MKTEASSKLKNVSLSKKNLTSSYSWAKFKMANRKNIYLFLSIYIYIYIEI